MPTCSVSAPFSPGSNSVTEGVSIKELTQKVSSFIHIPHSVILPDNRPANCNFYSYQYFPLGQELHRQHRNKAENAPDCSQQCHGQRWYSERHPPELVRTGYKHLDNNDLFMFSTWTAPNNNQWQINIFPLGILVYSHNFIILGHSCPLKVVYVFKSQKIKQRGLIEPFKFFINIDISYFKEVFKRSRIY